MVIIKQMKSKKNVGKVASPASPSPWKPLGERNADRELKRAAVLNTAAELFLANGYHRTKLNDVADQLHVTKPALYNYFTSKEDILLACFEAGTVLLNETLWSADHSHLRGLERLQKFVETWVLLMTMPFGRCMVLLDERELSDEYRQQVRKYKRDLDTKIRNIFKAGVADQSIAPLDPKLTVFAIMGLLNSVGRWYRSDGGESPEAIAQHFVEFVTRAIAPGAGEAHRLSKLKLSQRGSARHTFA